MKKIIIIASAAVALSAGVLASVKTAPKAQEVQNLQIQKVSISAERKDVATAD
jgi:heat shock protein HslJ